MRDAPAMLFADEDRSRQQVIGADLRRWYDAIAQEAVPDEWLELLDRSETKREGQPADASGKVRPE